MMIGRPMSSAIVSASATVWAMPDRGTSRPISIIASLNCSRSSAVAMAAALAPIISGVPGTPIRPWPKRSIARLRAVWPPSVGSTASGRSRSMMRANTSGVSGSM